MAAAPYIRLHELVPRAKPWANPKGRQASKACVSHGEPIDPANWWMMSMFEDREKAQENKKARDEELSFKATARRNKHLGLWAAGLLGLKDADAESYAKSVVEADLKEAGDNDVVAKVMADFAAKKVDMSEHRLRKQMDELMAKARVELGLTG